MTVEEEQSEMLGVSPSNQACQALLHHALTDACCILQVKSHLCNAGISQVFAVQDLARE